MREWSNEITTHRKRGMNVSEKIGEKSCLVKCKDCGKFFHFYYIGEWCEDCFDKGLHKDMNEHFDKFIKDDMNPTPTTTNKTGE